MDEAKVVFLSHRVEYLPLLEQEAERCDAIVLEEPSDGLLNEFLEGRMGLEEYLQLSDTQFPVFTRHQLKLLLKLQRAGKKIIQVEPYLQVIGELHCAIQVGRYEEYVKNEVVRRVLEVERKATDALLSYQESFMRGRFDEIVEKIIEFARADAERFRLRDELRAKALAELDVENPLIEAGYIHVLLPEYLRRQGVKVKVINLLEKAAESLGRNLSRGPGDRLTLAYILGESLGKEEKLLAAQALIYITLLGKDEKTPTPHNPFPHLTEELTTAEKVQRLNYRECRETFQKLWRIEPKRD